MRTHVIKGRAVACLAVISAAIAGGVLPSFAQTPSQPTGNGNEVAEGGEPLFRVTSPRSNVKITERFAKVVELQSKIVRVDGFDPEVVDVTALTPNQIRVQAVAPGVTTMVLVDEQGEMYSVDVFVAGDVRHLQAYIAHFFPDSSVEAVEVREAVVLRGWVTEPSHISEVVELAEQFYPRVINQMYVGGVQQVMLKVKVLEVQRSKMQALGLNLMYSNRDSFVTSTPGQLVTVGGINFAPPGRDSVSIGGVADPTIAFGIGDPGQLFQGYLEALKEEGLLKIRAEPSLVATNGRPATLLNGGEFPILVPQGLGTIAIEWREFGVRLNAVPIILGNGRVRLELEPEVSERDFSSAVEVNGLLVPGLTVRRTNTQVEMNFGETLVLAGLISLRDTANYSKVPLLGDIPLLSTAFSRKRYQETETELVIMVTPELVSPMDPMEVPPGGPGQFTDAPTFRELFHGHIEVPSCGDRCEGCSNCWITPGHEMLQHEEYIPRGPEAIPDAPPSPDMTSSSKSKRTLSESLTGWIPFTGKKKDGPVADVPQVRQSNYVRGGAANLKYDALPEENKVRQAVGSSPAPPRRSKPGLIQP